MTRTRATRKEDENDGQVVESWYADVPQPRTANEVTLDEFPLNFVDATDSMSFDQTPAHVAPLVAFFRLEENGIVLESPPVPMTDQVDARNAPTVGVAAAIDSLTSTLTSTQRAAPSTSRTAQYPYSYRHHFVQPVHGRFIVLSEPGAE
jgi:hypothetical protein